MRKAYFNIMLPDQAKILPQDDGSLIVQAVPIMAEGTWESMQGVNATFTSDVLKTAEWQDNPLWLRHPGGTSRAVNECIGSIINTRYDELPGEDGQPVKAQYGDLFLHGKTDGSKDAQQLVQMPEEQGGIKSISAETILDVDDVQNYGDPYAVTKITFTGAALVRHGACETCKLPDFEKSGEIANMANDSKQKAPPTPPAAGTTQPAQGTPPSPGGGPSMEDIKAAMSDVLSLKDVMSAIDGMGKKFEESLAKFGESLKGTHEEEEGEEECHEESEEEEEEESEEGDKKVTAYSAENAKLKAELDANKKVIADLQAKLAKRKNKSVPTTLAQPDVKADDSVSVAYTVRMDKHNFEIGRKR